MADTYRQERAGLLTEDEARREPCPFGLYDGKCAASKCRMAWRWGNKGPVRYMVTAPGREEERYSWDPRAHREAHYRAYKVRVVVPEIVGYCGATGDPTEKPDYTRDVEPPKRQEHTLGRQRETAEC